MMKRIMPHNSNSLIKLHLRSRLTRPRRSNTDNPRRRLNRLASLNRHKQHNRTS